jgi:hypothetical protein
MILALGISTAVVVAAFARDKAKANTKPISNQTQAEAAKAGTYRVKGELRLYLNKDENGAGAWFYARDERPGNSRPVRVEDIAPRACDVSDERRVRSIFRWHPALIQIP